MDLLLKEEDKSTSGIRPREGRETFPATDGPQLSLGSRMQERCLKIDSQPEASATHHAAATALTRKTLLFPLSTQTLLRRSVDLGGGGGEGGRYGGSRRNKNEHS